jgi:hypothetical protein
LFRVCIFQKHIWGSLMLPIFRSYIFLLFGLPSNACTFISMYCIFSIWLSGPCMWIPFPCYAFSRFNFVVHLYGGL